MLLSSTDRTMCPPMAAAVTASSATAIRGASMSNSSFIAVPLAGAEGARSSILSTICHSPAPNVVIGVPPTVSAITSRTGYGSAHEVVLPSPVASKNVTPPEMPPPRAMVRVRKCSTIHRGVQPRTKSFSVSVSSMRCVVPARMRPKSSQASTTSIASASRASRSIPTDPGPPRATMRLTKVPRSAP